MQCIVCAERYGYTEEAIDPRSLKQHEAAKKHIQAVSSHMARKEEERVQDMQRHEADSVALVPVELSQLSSVAVQASASATVNMPSNDSQANDKHAFLQEYMDIEMGLTCDDEYQFMDSGETPMESIWERMDREEEAMLQDPEEIYRVLVEPGEIHENREDMQDEDDETSTNVLRALGKQS